MDELVNIHVHSDIGSILDGLDSPVTLAQTAKDLGQSHICASDHGSLAAHRPLQQACREIGGIKPILGCLLPGQEIHTIDGFKKIEDVCIGDMVLTHKGRWRKVISTMCREYDGNVYSFSPARKGSRKFTVTAEHPILIFDKDGDSKWMRADHVEAGRVNKHLGAKCWKSFVGIPKLSELKSNTYFDPIVDESRYFIDGGDFCGYHFRAGRKRWAGWGRPKLIDAEFARFLGLFVAEGSAGDDGLITFTFNINEDDYVAFIVEYLSGLGLTVGHKKRKHKGTHDIWTCSIPLSRMLQEYCGKGAKNKVVPKQIIEATREIQDQFLSGLADGDAKITKNSSGSTIIYLKASSQKLIWGVRSLLANKGSYAEVKPAFDKRGYTAWSIQWTENARFKRSIQTKSHVLIGLRSVESVRYTGKVYNFEVEQDNSYVSDFIVHNCEIYYTGDRWDRTPRAERDETTGMYSHMILLAKNNNGLKNLNKIVEESWKSFYSKPLTDFELLSELGDDLIVTSACMGGVISKLLLAGRDDAARDLLIKFKARWGNDFYTEIQSHNPIELNLKLIDLSEKLGIKLVAATDAHYASESDRELEEAFLILSSKPKLGKDVTYLKSLDHKEILDRYNYLYPDRKMSFQDIDLFLQTRQQMQSAFAKVGIDRQDIFDHTLEIADKIKDYDFLQKQDLLPRPSKVDPNITLKNSCESALTRMNLDVPEYRQRLEHELEVIVGKDFSTYFLIVADIIRWAKNSGILIGPGRGSVGGCLVAYLLNITEIDPIEYNLPFARFLDPERADVVDIDIDVEDRRRSEVKDYVRKRFGEENVAGISTYTYFKDKGVFRDAARVFYVPLGDVNKFLKGIDTFEECEHHPDKEWFRIKYPEVISLARKLRGRVRGVGMHAAGIVISNKPISDYAPIETRIDPNNKLLGRVSVVAYDKYQAEDVGLIKIDLLGLKTLSVISDCQKEIKSRRDKKIILTDIKFNDDAVYKDLSNGFTRGVFQAEASPYTKLLKEMKVGKFDDLAISNALVRPGAMNTIGADLIAVKHGRKRPVVMHDIYKQITDNTYSYVVYQDQVMMLCVELAGMSWGDASRVRSIIGKKKDPAEFEQYQEQFVSGASKYISKKKAEKLWHDFEAHAGYSFNAAHAVGYSMISYWTAWLKHYYPVEFLYSILRNQEDDDKTTDYLIEAKRLGVKVLMPHVNYSDLEFKIEQNNSIRFGLTSIKYIAENSGARIISQRPYESYQHLLSVSQVKKSGINSRAIGSLNAIGAAEFKDNPLRGDESENFYEYLGIPNFSINVPEQWSGQLLKLDEFDKDCIGFYHCMVKGIKKGMGWSRLDLVDGSGSAGVFDRENTQIEVGHMYLMLISNNSIVRAIDTSQLEEFQTDPIVRFLNAEELKLPEDKKAVVAFNSRKMKNGKPMATCILANKEKELVSAVVFNNLYARGLGLLRPGSAAKVKLAQTKTGGMMIEEIVK